MEKGLPQPGLEEAGVTEKGGEKEKHAEDGDRPGDMCDRGLGWIRSAWQEIVDPLETLEM